MSLRKNFEPTTCTIVKYVNYTIGVPYQDNLGHGGCAHLYEVMYMYSTVKGGVKNISAQAVIPDISYGTCTPTSYKRSHWSLSPSEISAGNVSHSCYYNRINVTNLVLDLPPKELAAKILLIIVVLLPPAILWIVTLVYVIIGLISCCVPSLKRQLLDPNDGGGGDDGMNPAVIADDGAEANVVNPVEANHENGDIDHDEEGGAIDPNSQSSNSSSTSNLTPAQRQMLAQGWYLPPQSSS
eukprot:MONOS_489.1-p1 / transcript=MONOS_489.1 / gene=MONOS_489 / organism=Monocercomonoides_exilis_PA203 / gene_product=unspecified product / transcript_product=unspecified product / location=Mono_scaffold00008:6271-7126(-) / protein_length=240 / sequence_SO=supercontig / SO=protein_coding / is_pseudo=false